MLDPARELSQGDRGIGFVAAIGDKPDRITCCEHADGGETLGDREALGTREIASTFALTAVAVTLVGKKKAAPAVQLALSSRERSAFAIQVEQKPERDRFDRQRNDLTDEQFADERS